MQRRMMKVVMMLVALACGYMQAFSQDTVKNVVLVHGAFADGSGWEAVHKLLTKKGYKVSIVANPLTSFQQDVDAVKIAIKRHEGKVILVGHSYGGAIITEAGNDPAVAGLVFVAAVAPDANEPIFAMVQNGVPTKVPGGIVTDNNGYAWFDKAKFHAGFCADVPKEKAAFMADAQVPFAAASFGATIPQPAWKTKKSWYIVATEDNAISPITEREIAKRAGAAITEIKGSHVVYMTKPVEVAKVIVAATVGSTK